MEALIKTCRKHRGTLQTTATLLAIKIAYDGPMNWWDYVCVQARLWKIQLSNLLTAAGPSPSIASLIGANIALWQLLRIEHVHLMEKRKLLRNNMDPFGRLDPNLPHVESLAKRAAEKKKLGMKYVRARAIHVPAKLILALCLDLIKNIFEYKHDCRCVDVWRT